MVRFRIMFQVSGDLLLNAENIACKKCPLIGTSTRESEGCRAEWFEEC